MLMRAWAKLRWRPDLAIDDFRSALETLDRDAASLAWWRAQEGLSGALMVRALGQRLFPREDIGSDRWSAVLSELGLERDTVGEELPVLESPDPERDMLDAVQAVEAALEVVTSQSDAGAHAVSRCGWPVACCGSPTGTSTTTTRACAPATPSKAPAGRSAGAAGTQNTGACAV